MIYIRNKDLLREIWDSKLSYCEIIDADHLLPDLIVDDLANITEPDKTIRLDTHDHIPLAVEGTEGKGKLGHLSGSLTFEPFILYRSYLDDRGKIAFRETARSHHRAGKFAPDHGRLTSHLGMMLITMVEKYGKKSNWNGYSYREEMEGEAILNLSQNVLKFNEAKSDNPHAYISMCMKTTFIRELRKQHKQAHIKDELMMMEGLTPSHGRQLDHQLASRER